MLFINRQLRKHCTCSSPPFLLLSVCFCQVSIDSIPFQPNMAYGTLEVVLVNAKGLHNTDFLSKMDPYVIFTLKTQEKKSTVAKGQGSEPAWNESFLFTVTNDVSELHLKIMDEDTFTADDYVGESTISLEPVFNVGIVPPTAYNVVNKDQEYHGEIKIGLNFSPEPETNSFCSGHYGGVEDYGGWKESTF
ncbi:elicitor-responsive protein 3-like isoform X2 [Rosa rugosa]|uniref:elicitor-responsive protein 3-like isoform X2 n=1 Tax=Rosa rugosa TaxID=74645 RepID=UPI002B411A10|nr:elicitor-responsive protein 3-like isoform X2 [Rosa rugosa]